MIFIKDWIFLFVPVLLNGLVVLTIQILFETKKIKRNEKIPVLKQLVTKTKEFNNAFIVENIKLYQEETDISSSLNIFQNFIVEIIKIYDSNMFHLKKAKKEIDNLQTSWESFKENFNNTTMPISMDDSKMLADKLNNVKKELQKLIQKLDKLIVKVI